MKTRLLACALACLLSFALPSHAAPGDLDSTFGTVGKVATPIDNGGFGSSVAVQGDGKIVVAGTCFQTTNDFALMRYHANGTLDSSFGQGGKVITPIGTAEDQGRSVAIQSDGKIVVVGNSYSGTKSNFAVARYTAAGELDTTFNSTGTVITPIGSGNDLARAVVILSDGRIVVAGETQNGGNADFAVVRYTATGALDTTFNTTGKVITPIGSGNDVCSSLTIQNDGKIVAAGWASNGSNFDFAVVRYTTPGLLDTSFGPAGTGKVTTAIGSNDDLGNKVTVQPDGKIVVIGSSFNSGGGSTNNDFAVVRYHTNGTLDTTFDGDGRASTNFGTANSDEGFSVAIQSDGKIVVAGYSRIGSDDEFAVVRYNTNGTLDNSFDLDGGQTTDFTGENDRAQGVALQSDGRIVAAGLSIKGGTNSFALVCYASNGALDSTFGSGTLTTAIGSSNDQGNAVAIQSDSKIVVAGSSYNPGGGGTDYDIAVARYHANGTLDASFDYDGKTSTYFGTNNIDEGYSVAIQSDGKIVVAGTSRVDGDYDFAVVRYNADGSLDTTFDTDGGQTTDFGDDERAQSVVIDSDGKIIVAGYSDRGFYGEDFALARYKPDGSPDTTFSGDGKLRTDIGLFSSERGYGVALQSDGKILVVGDFRAGTDNYMALLRYNTDGSLDTSFGPYEDGKALFITTGNDHARSVAVQPDEKILVAGYGNYGSGTGGDRFVLVRFDSFGDYEGHTVTPVGSGGARATSMAIQRDGKILVAGTGYNGREDDLAVLRYGPNAQLDPTFGSGGKVLASVGLTDAGQAIALQSDGKIVAAGSSYTGGEDFALARILGDPTPVYAPDLYEQNDSRDSPNPITSVFPGRILEATIHHANDHDWARWTLPTTGLADAYVSLIFSNAAGSGDLALEVYRQVGSSWVLQAPPSNTSTGDRTREDISMAGWPAGNYATHVYSIGGGTNIYEIRFGYGPELDPTDSPNRADIDSTAFSLGSLSLFSERWTFRDLSIDTSTDQDWFSFTLDYVPLNGTYFRIDFDPTLADLDISLWRWNADLPPTFLSNATSSGSGFEKIDLSASLAAGTYLVKVAGHTAGTRSPSYSLAWDAPVGADSYEIPPRNNTSSAPTLLGAISGFRRYDALSLHTVPEGSVRDVDFYSFSTSAVGQKKHSIVVETDYTDTPLEVNLYAMIGSIPRWVGSAVRSVDYTISLEGLPSGNYLLEVYNQQAVPVRNYAINVLAPGTSSITDRFEQPVNNNVAGSATSFTARQGFYRANGLTLPASDVDWFKIRLKSQGQRGHYVAVDFENAYGAGDLDLYLYDATGSTLLASSLSSQDREYLSLEGLGPAAPPATVDYLVKVVGYNGASSAYYSLSLNLPGSDLFEQDAILDQQFSDSKAKAVALPGPGKPLTNYQQWSNLSIQPSDDDWFVVKFESAPTRNDYVEIRFNHADGDLGLEVQHGAQSLKSESVGNVERVSLGDFTQVAGDTTFYIRVVGDNGRGNPTYDLIIDGPGASVGDWADVYQTVGLPGNNAPGTATDLTPVGQANRMGERRWNDPARPLSIHTSTDLDWYRFAVDASSTGAEGDEVTIQFDHALGDIDLELYKRTGGTVSSPALTLVGKSVGVGDTHTVSLKDQLGGDYFLKVSGYNGATNPAYALAIRAQWAPPVADVHELSGNNTRLTATNLGTIAGEWNANALSLSTSADEDWYRFSMPVDGDATSQVNIAFNYRLGDLNLQLYDNNGVLQGTSNALRSNSETLSLYGKPLGDYYVRVYGKQNRDYSLQIRTTRKDTTTTTVGDWAEPNEQFSQPRNLRNVTGFQQWESLSIHVPSDQDWFTFTTTAQATADHFVAIDFSHALGNLDIELLDANGAPFNPPVKSEALADREVVYLHKANGGAAGVYHLKVTGVSNAVNPRYLLSMNAPSPWPGDWAEGPSRNESLSAAAVLGPVNGWRQWTGFSIHQGGDQDWFAFDIPSGLRGVDGHTASIFYDQTLGDIELQLLDSVGTPLLASANAADRETVSLANLNPGRYHLRVYGSSGTATNPSYSLVIDGPALLKRDWTEGGTASNPLEITTDLRQPTENVTATNLSIHTATDVDWFRLELLKAPLSSQSVRIDFKRSEGDLDLQVTAPNGTILNATSGYGNFEEVSLGGLPLGVYVVRVTSTQTDPLKRTIARYSLSINSIRDLKADWAESNNDAQTAPKLELSGSRMFGTGTGFSFNPQSQLTPQFSPQTINPFGVNSFSSFSDPLSGLAQTAQYGSVTNLIGQNQGSFLVAGIAGLTDSFGNPLQMDQRNPALLFPLNDSGLFTGPSQPFPWAGLPPFATPVVSEPDDSGNLALIFALILLFKGDADVALSGQARLLGDELGDQSLIAGNAKGAESLLVLPDLSIDTATDEDWFKITLDSDGRTGDFVRIRFEHELGDLRLELLNDSNPPAPVFPAINGTSDSEQINLAGVRKGTYYLRVTGVNAATNPEYALAVVVSTVPTLAKDYKEGFTDNNVSTRASDLGLAVGTTFIPGLSIESGADVDWFKFELQVAARAGDFLRLDFDHALGDIDLILFAAANPGVELRFSKTTANFEEIDLDGLGAGAYLAKVVGATTTATNPSYDLTLSVWDTSILKDVYEPNPQASPTIINAASTTRLEGLTIHPTTPADEDWFEFQMTATGRSGDLVQVECDPSKGELQLTVYGPTGAALPSSATLVNGRGTYVTLNAQPAGKYRAKVEGVGGSANRYALSVIAAQAPTIGGGQTQYSTEWNVMIYMTASDLEASAFRDINELEDFVARNLPPSVKISVFLDQSSLQGRTTFPTGAGREMSESIINFSATVAGTRGWSFTTAAPIEITALGFRDAGTPGLGASHQVGVWNNSGQLVAAATVAAGRAGTFDGATWVRYATLSPAILLPQGTYRIGGTIAPGDGDTYAADIKPVGSPGYVTYGQPCATSGANLSNPSPVTGISQAYFGPNFMFRPAGGGVPRAGVTFQGWGDSGYAIIQPDTDKEVVRTTFVKQGEKNSGDPATLKAFISWAKGSAPAQKYALILWDHGGGELDGSNFDTFDTTPGDKLTVTELLTCLSQVKSEAIVRPATQRPFDLIAFDACLMGMLETAYGLRDYSGVFVGSQENVPDDGFEYRNAFAPLATAPRLTTALELATAMVRSYEAQYRLHSARWNTLSAVNTDLLPPLLTELGTLNAEIMAGASTATDWQAVEQARNGATNFKEPYYRDLGQYLQAFASSAARTAIKNAASNALAKLNGPGGAVIARTNEPRQCGGLSVYFPQMGVSLPDSAYLARNTAFFTETGWNGFLTSYISRTPTMTLASVSTVTGGRSALSADWAEANDTANIATQLFDLSGPGNLIQGLSLDHSTDEDWYRFTTRATGNSSSRVLVTASGSPAPNVVATLYSGADLTTPIVGPTTASAITLSLNTRPPGEYLLNVRPVAGVPVTDYRVQIDAPTAPNGRADWATGNVSLTKAYNLGLIPGERLFAGLAVAPLPVEDWFVFSTPRTGNNTEGAILITPAQGTTAELQVWLHQEPPDTTWTDKSVSGSGPMVITYPADRAVTYHLRVTSNAPGGGADINYSLHFNPVNRGGLYGSADFQSWMASFPHLLAGQRLLNVDADGDGRTNLLEYALDARPDLNDATGAPVVSITTVGSNRYLTLEVPGTARRWDVNYVIEVSANMVTWFSDAGNVTVLPNTGTIIKARDNTPLTPGAKRFIRLRVVQP